MSRLAIVAAGLVFAGSSTVSAHEHGGKHAGTAEECKAMAGKSSDEMKKCNACVAQSGHHYHFGKMKGDRCHEDANDPMSPTKKK